MLGAIISLVSVWLAALKTREHFLKYPIRMRKKPPEIPE